MGGQHRSTKSIDDTSQSSLQWYDDDHLEKISTAFITILGLALFIIPLWILNTTMSKSNASKKLGLITGCIVGFYSLVAKATTAKPFESLAACAG
jgi:uncharacterized membrane protein